VKKHTVVTKTVRTLSPWAKLAAKQVQVPGHAELQEYHSFVLDDYVTVLGLTRAGEIPLVRQYRPALEGYSLELPGGLLESGEDPARTAARELYEETGYKATEELVALGCLNPDSGRLENRLWCYFASGIDLQCPQEWQPEPDVQVIMMDKRMLLQAIRNGEFKHALHLGIIALAVIQGHLSLPGPR